MNTLDSNNREKTLAGYLVEQRGLFTMRELKRAIRKKKLKVSGHNADNLTIYSKVRPGTVIQYGNHGPIWAVY